MITTKVKTNFSFTKLAKNFNKVTEVALNSAAKDSAIASKSNIDNRTTHTGSPIRKLSDPTLSARKRGIYWEGEGRGVKGEFFEPKMLKTNIYSGGEGINIGGDTPLKYTGNLYNSIRAKKNELAMEGYGAKHNRGYALTKWHVPARPFIEVGVFQSSIDSFFKEVKKYFRK